MTTPKPLVIDLSHWDPAYDYAAVKNEGIVGVIYKATEGASYTDPTYSEQQRAAKEQSLLWGAYHFADSSLVSKQIDNFMRYACPDPDELLCLDWEDNSGDTMSLEGVKTWIAEVENQLGRWGQCVLYGGNTIKEALGDEVDTFLGERRLWLCQYGDDPVVQRSWESYWLWQYTDGVYGPTPHAIEGVGACDISSYEYGKGRLMAEWSGSRLSNPWPTKKMVSIAVYATPGVTVKVRQAGSGMEQKQRRRR